jgi:hypothetical protein
VITAVAVAVLGLAAVIILAARMIAWCRAGR